MDLRAGDDRVAVWLRYWFAAFVMVGAGLGRATAG
jgi:hypothetical protein